MRPSVLRVLRGAAIDVLGRIVDEVVFGEQPERLVRRGDRSRHQRRDARLEARLDRGAVIVALIGDHHRSGSLEDVLGGGCGKGGQFPLPVTEGAPHVRFRELPVGGEVGGA